MSLRRVLLWPLLLLAVLCGSCGSEVGKLSQVLLVVQGGQSVRDSTDKLVVALKSGDVKKRDSWQTKSPEIFVNFDWPASLALLPSGDAASTGFEIEVTAYHGNMMIVSSRVISSFVPLHTVLLEVDLDDECINMFACGDDQTCRVTTDKAECVSAVVDSRKLPEYDGKDRHDVKYDAGGKTQDAGGDGDVSDAGGHADNDAGHGGDGDAHACVPSGAEDCFNKKDDDCNGKTDCADSACGATKATCVPGESMASVIVGKDEACPAGFDASSKVVHQGLKGGGCAGCSCDVGATTCAADIYVYVQDFNTDPMNLLCFQDVDNNAGKYHQITRLLNDWQHSDNTMCDSPIEEGNIEGWRTEKITATDGMCSPKGTAAPETPAWTKDAKLCFAKAVGGGCAAEQVCAPVKAGSQRCGVVKAGATCKNGTATWFEGFDDSRTCGSCRCDDGAGGNCNGIKVRLGHDYGCNDNLDNNSAGPSDRFCFGTVNAPTSDYSPPAFLTGTPTNKTCVPNASTSGALATTGRIDVCCE